MNPTHFFNLQKFDSSVEKIIGNSTVVLLIIYIISVRCTTDERINRHTEIPLIFFFYWAVIRDNDE